MHVEPKSLVLSHLLLEHLPLTLQLDLFLFAHALHINFLIHSLKLPSDQTFHVFKRFLHLFMLFELVLYVAFNDNVCISALICSSIIVLWLKLTKLDCSTSFVWRSQLGTLVIFKRYLANLWCMRTIIIVASTKVVIIFILVSWVPHVVMIILNLEST